MLLPSERPVPPMSVPWCAATVSLSRSDSAGEGLGSGRSRESHLRAWPRLTSIATSAIAPARHERASLRWHVVSGATRYFKRHWPETRGDEYDTWGPAGCGERACRFVSRVPTVQVTSSMIVALIEGDDRAMEVLRSAAALGLPDWWIGRDSSAIVCGIHSATPHSRAGCGMLMSHTSTLRA